MKRYENDGNTYSLPLKINLAHSKRMFGYNLIVFLFIFNKNNKKTMI